MSDMNLIFNEFARAFLGKLVDDLDIAFPDQLPRHLLDGTLESLHLVDKYLSYVHERQNQIGDDLWNITVLRTGAYLGEVIRHSAPAGFFNWVDYDEYIPKHKKLQGLMPERTTATCAFLVDNRDSMTMPLNKVARFIAEGIEHSVHFFAVCDLNKVPKGDA